MEEVVTTPLQVFFSRFRKVRQKARRALQGLDDIDLPGGDEEPPEENDSDTSSSGGGKWLALFFLTLILLGGGWYFFSPGAKERKVKYEFIYGEAQVYSQKIGFYRSQGDDQLLPEGEKQKVLTEKNLAAIQFPNGTIVEIRGDSILEMERKGSSISFRLFKGAVFFDLKEPHSFEVGEFPLSLQESVGYVEIGNQPKLALLEGQGESFSGQELRAPYVYHLGKDRALQQSRARVPQWIAKVPGISPVFFKASTEKEEKSPPFPRKKKDPKKTIKTTGNQKTPRPPYPYQKPQWKVDMARLLGEKKVKIEMEDITLEALLAQLSNTSGVKIAFDPNLPLKYRQEQIPSVDFENRSLQSAFQWICERERDLKYILDQQQVIFYTSSRYTPQLTEGEKILLLFEYSREFVKLSQKKLVKVKEILNREVAEVGGKEMPLIKALEPIREKYPHSLRLDQTTGDAKVTYRGGRASLAEHLKGILEPLGLEYAPRNISGALEVTSARQARHLWADYRRKVRWKKEGSREEEALRKNLLQTWIKVDFDQVQPWEICRSISRQSGVNIFLDQSLWRHSQPYSIKGRYTLEQILNRLFSKEPTELMAWEPYLFAKYVRPKHSSLEVPRGIYVFSQ